MFRKRTESYRFEEVPNDEYLQKKSLHSIHIAYAYVWILFGILLYGLVYWVDNKLVNGIKISEEINYPDTFISERAQNNLKTLTDIGPKVTGTYENEVQAVEFLKREISHIMLQADSNQTIEMDLQVTSGSYYLDFKPYGLVNVYDNVQNIVVKLHSSEETNTSLLLNCHFDSVPGSPGGSDDGIMCVTMLEVLRVMSKRKVRPLNNVLFLFNGAEENPLQASHGFITQHKWAPEVRILINLEAAGAGSSEMLFQTGPNNPWLVDYYSQVPHPSGQVAGEEIFQSNLLPSDTDFRIFRDFGNVTGYDFAFPRNGYVYHTKYDGFDNIPLGSFQHVGDNTLKLTTILANAVELRLNGTVEGKSVYYDIFGIYLINYSHVTGTIINVIACCCSLITIICAISKNGRTMKNMKSLALSSGMIILSWITAIAFLLLVGFVLDCLNCTMSWYNKPYLIIGLYVAPNIAICCSFVIASNRFKYQKYTTFQSYLSPIGQTQMQLHSNCLIWTLVLMALTIYGIRSAYILMIPVLFQSICFLLIYITGFEQKGRWWLYAYLIALLVPISFIFYNTVILYSVFIPIFGRIGSIINPEFLVAGVTFLMFTISCSFYVPLITLIRKPYIVIGSLFGIFLITLVVTLTPLGFPYSGNDNAPTPQRHWIWHTQRTFFDENNNTRKADSGYLLLNMDRNSPHSIHNVVKEMKNATTIAKDCETELLCGVPLYTSRMLAIFKKSTWIPAEVPVISLPTTLRLNSVINATTNTRRYNFTASGPNHMSIFISPKINATLKQWSFTDSLPENQIIIDGRKNYFILFASGLDVGKLEFWIDVQVSSHMSWTAPTFDIAVSGKYIDKKYKNTENFSTFLNHFPKWAHVTAWIATYTSWVY